MAKSVDLSGLKQFEADLKKLQSSAPVTVEKTTKELAKRLLRLVKNKTDAGEKPELDGLTEDQKKTADAIWEGYEGGTLRRGWTATAPKYTGNIYSCDVFNDEKYGLYYEYGHYQERGRYVPALGKSLSKSWVKGRFVLTKSLVELDTIAPNVMRKNIDAMMKEVFK